MATQQYLPMKVELDDFRAMLYFRDWDRENLAVHGKTEKETLAKAESQIPDLESRYKDKVKVTRIQRAVLESGIEKYVNVAVFSSKNH